MNRLVAIGDIHGCSQTFEVMIQRLDLAKGDTLLLTGDLSAKGIDSRGVHQQLIKLEESGIELIILVGNHELMLLGFQRFIGADFELEHVPDRALNDGEINFFMRGNGGWATLKSYGFDRVDDRILWAFDRDNPCAHFEKIGSMIGELGWRLPTAHLQLLARCRTHYISRNCLFVHAGLDPELLRINNAEEAVQAQLDKDASDLSWNRAWLGTKPAFPELIVHGHTPLSCLYSFFKSTEPWKCDDLVFKSVIHLGALNLDSGAFLESGHLTAVEIPEDGDVQKMKFVRIPRLDPVEKDKLWHVNFTS